MTRPRNVLFLIRTWAMGGGNTIALMLMRHLPRDRFNVIAVPYDAHTGHDGQFADAAAAQGTPCAPERIPWRSRSAWFKARETLAQLITHYDIDLLHTHDPHSNVLAGLGRSRWNCACVASPYGWWERVFPLRSHAYVWVERQVALPRFDRLITVSQAMKQKILKGPSDPERIRVIHTGIDPASVRPTVSRAEARAQFDIPGNAVVVGTVSRVYIEKGHRYLLDALARALPASPALHLLVVGDGPERHPLEEQARALGIADRVRFPGYVAFLPDTLAAMDLLTLPSILEEGFPTVLVEAQLAGLPVVASDIGGVSETLDPGVTGLLVPPRDTAALADALSSLARDPVRRATMGCAARDWVANSFPLDGMIRQVADTYDEVLTEHAGRITP